MQKLLIVIKSIVIIWQILNTLILISEVMKPEEMENKLELL